MLKPLFTNTNFQLIHPSLHPILSPYPSHLHGFSPSPSPSPYSSRILSFSPCPYPILCFLSLHPSFSLSFSPLLIPPSLHPSIPPSLLSLHPSILYGNGSFAFYESFTAFLYGCNGSFAFYPSIQPSILLFFNRSMTRQRVGRSTLTEGFDRPTCTIRLGSADNG